MVSDEMISKAIIAMQLLLFNIFCSNTNTPKEPDIYTKIYSHDLHEVLKPDERDWRNKAQFIKANYIKNLKN